MSNTNTSPGGVTRRGFLKTAAAAGAIGLAGAAGMTTSGGWLAPATASADAQERVAYTYHQSHCGGHCMMKCTVRDGRLCLIEPNEAAREGFRTVCVKGLAEIQHVYSADRIQTPLKRVGERGSGQFEPITWDEAMQIFGENVKRIKEEYGMGSVIMAQCGECEDLMGMMSVVGAGLTGVGIDTGIANGLAPVTGTSNGRVFNSADDWVNSKNIIIVSGNFLESGLVHSGYLFDAQEAGAHTICIDPHFCTTASKCDEWIPIEPGTDGALFLGMISHIIDNDWQDVEFMRANTSFPFLVSTADGSLMRDHVDATGKEKGATNPFFVWDEQAQAALPYTQATSPALEGTYEVNGIECTTVFSLLKENQKAYDTAWAEEQTGIPAATIERLARIYAIEGPCMLSCSLGGIDKYSNSDTVGHALGVLAALTGQLGKPGCGMADIHTAGWQSAALPTWPLDKSLTMGLADMPQFEMPYNESAARCFISIGDQLQQRFPDFNKAVEWVKKLDFFVCADVFFGTSAVYADLVLPICSRFESPEEVGGLRAKKNHLMLREKVIEPLFDSKHDFELSYEFARALGVEASLPKSIEERLSWQLANPIDPRLKGMTLDKLREMNGVFPLPGTEEPLVSNADQVYATTSGRLDVYTESLVAFDQALPNYEGPDETAKDSELRAKYPIQLAQLRSRFHIHSEFCDATWIRQYSTACVEINPVDMAARGLVNGDEVEVFNDRGSFGCSVYGNESIRPGSARVIEGEWSKFMTSGNIQNVTNPTSIERGKLLPYGPVIPFNDTLVEIKKA